MDKINILLHEAEKDIEVGCYNKAVSACYFAVRMQIEVLANKLGSNIPRRGDKLINILKNLGKDDLAKHSLYLYERRKDADYGHESLNKDTALACLSISRRLV
ncbi:HEPN domain-containing protein [Stygiolobus caldivivus]|uniref:HEPN domain-containing protein n=1 Tax=Stygiolobus caldivivus TaxID=2824673 RepID=A0A8D5U831_9CREN|nr:HEPN domain-containing protein [Stygiolobus caldivivus]BCU71088.1 hypothetical protein KN1_23850 [Stygiolobus caldivivus]